MREFLRQRKRSGESHDAAHAAPRHNKAALQRRRHPGKIRAAAKSRERRPHQGVVGHHPDQACENDCHEHRSGHHGIVEAVVIVHALPDRAQLHADQHEGEHVEQEDHGFPHRVGGDAQPRRGARGRGAGDGDGVGHDRQDAGEPEMLGDNPHREGAGELHDDRTRHVGDPCAEQHRELGEEVTRNEAAEQRQCDCGGEGLPAEMPGHGDADGDAIDQERAGIVEQAFALQDFQDAIGQFHRAQDRGGRCGVRRRDDGPEHDRRRPRQVRHQPVRDHGDAGGRHANSDKHQGGDRQPVVPEIAQRGVIGRVEQHRRNEQRQRQFRLQCPGRGARQEGQQHASNSEKGRVGNADPPRHRRQNDRSGQQADNPFKGNQNQSLSRRPGRVAARAARLEAMGRRFGKSRHFILFTGFPECQPVEPGLRRRRL